MNKLLFLFSGLVLHVVMQSGLSAANTAELNVIDNFSTDSRVAYVTNRTSEIFDLPEANWRISNNKYYCAPINRNDQWNNNAATKRAATLYRKNERLEAGQAISINVGHTDKGWKYEKLGLVIEGTSFIIGPGEAGYYLGLGGLEYDLQAGLNVEREIVLTLVRGTAEASDSIFWSAIGGGIAQQGKYKIPNLPEKAWFGFTFSGGYREQMRDMYLSNFRHGNMDVSEIEDVPFAELTIESKLPPINRNDKKPALRKEDGELSSSELRQLVEWAVSEPGQWSNHGNRALSGHTRLYKVYKVYDKSKDIRILNNLVNIAEMALESRNDRNTLIGSFKTLSGFKDGKWTYAYDPTWPHFMGWNEQDGERYYHGDVGEDAVGIHYLALAARAIAETPEIWDQNAPGTDKTYLELANTYVNEAIYTVEESVIPKFIEPGTLESIYQYRRSLPGTSTLDIGGFVPFNRFWHVPVAFVSLCPAMELLNIEPEKIQTYDSISQVSINRWLKSMDHSRKEGLDLIVYPYSYPQKSAYEKNPEAWSFMPSGFTGFSSEDLNHLGADASELYILYFSKRYDLPVDILKKFANALLLNTKVEGDEYLSYRMDGGGRGQTKTLSNEAYFLTQFQPRLKTMYWDNPFQDVDLLKEEIVFLELLNPDSEKPGNDFEEIEISFTIDGENWEKSNRISVPKGANVTIKASFPDEENSYEWLGPDAYNKSGQSIIFNNIDLSHAGIYEVYYSFEGQVVKKNSLELTVFDPQVATPPSVSFVNPPNAKIAEGSTLSIQVEATDYDGIANVQLFLNDELLSAISEAPYSWNENSTIPQLTNMQPGDYTLKAVAEDHSDLLADTTISFTVVEGSEIRYIETLEKVPFTGWGIETYIGDNGFEWTADGKSVSAYMSESKQSYSKNKTIISSGIIPGGISSFSVDCMNKWNDGTECTIELLVNGTVVASKTSTSQNEAYKFEVSNINIAGDITIGINIGTQTIVIDNISWTSYIDPATNIINTKKGPQYQVYPNPFTSELNIETEGDFTEVTLMDISGRTVATQTPNGNTHVVFRLDNNKVPSGIYLVRLKSKKGVIHFKVLKK